APKAPSHADYGALAGLNAQSDYLIKSDQLKGCNNLLSCLSGSMGLLYTNNLLYLSRGYNAGNSRPIEIYANGISVDIYYLQGLQVRGIESIEEFVNDSISRINSRTGTSGVMVINMEEIKKVNMSSQEIADLFPLTNVMFFMP